MKMNQLKIHQLKDKEDQYFANFWEIYSDSFPLNERRTIKQQESILNKVGYQLNIYLSDIQVIGFIAFWTAKEFVFIEHFAVAPEVRSKGLGSIILKPFIESKAIPVILEIETPVNELKRRRLKFYELLGFTKNDHIHFQPPYHKGEKPLRLEILAYPAVISDDLYNQFALFQKENIMV